MNKYVIAAFSVVVAIGPASALDVGLGGKVGGIGVGAGLGLGKGSASVKGGLGVDKVGRTDVEGSVGASKGNGVSANVGAGAKVDGVGGANLGGSLGVSRGSLDAGLGVSGNLGGKSGSLGADVGLGGKSSSGGGTNTAPGTGAGGAVTGSVGATDGSATRSGAGSKAGAASGIAAEFGSGETGAGSSAGAGPIKGMYPVVLPRTLVVYRIILPRILRPSNGGRHELRRGTWGYPLGSLAPIVAKPGSLRSVVRACRQAIVSAAAPLGAVRVSAASAGPLRRQRRGAVTAPIEVRIHYATQGGVEVRQARTRCRLDAAGRVIALK